MKNRKRLMALSLGFVLTFGQAAYAEMIVPPITSIGSTMGNGAVGNPNTSTSPVPSDGSGTASVQEPAIAAEGAVLMDLP